MRSMKKTISMAEKEENEENELNSSPNQECIIEFKRVFMFSIAVRFFRCPIPLWIWPTVSCELELCLLFFLGGGGGDGRFLTWSTKRRNISKLRQRV